MTEDREKSNFWATLPGILTGLATLIGALIAALAAFDKMGTDVTTSKKLANFQVNADSEEGYTYYYPKNEKPAKLSYEAIGKWTPIPIDTKEENIPKGEITAQGFTDFGINYNPSRPCGNKYNLGALVVNDLGTSETEKCVAGGAESDFEAQPRRGYQFVMSDVYKRYTDNTGHIEVTIYKKSDME